MVFCSVTFLSLVCITLIHYVDGRISPDYLVSVTGRSNTFTCSEAGSIVWLVDDTPVSYKNGETLQRQGVSLEVQQNGDQVESRLTISSTQGQSNSNNTLLKCVVLNAGSAASTFTARLAVISMTPVDLAILESFPEQFGLSWDQVYVPSGYSVTKYLVELSDETGGILKTDSVVADATQRSYSYVYPLKQGLSSFPECTLRKFSVSAVTTAGTTESVMVSWKNPKMKVELTDVTCVVVNESFVRVEFTKPVCSFEMASYSISLKQGSFQAGFAGGQLSGAGDSTSELLKSLLSIKASDEFKASLTVQVNGGKTLSKEAVCIAARGTISPAGLGSSGGSSGLTGSQVAIIVIFVCLTVVAMAALVALLVFIIRR